MDAEARYHLLFNRITDAIEELDSLNVGRAKAILIRAQQEAEEGYLEEEEAEAEDKET